jgi:hypothetical protein
LKENYETHFYVVFAIWATLSATGNLLRPGITGADVVRAYVSKLQKQRRAPTIVNLRL